MQPSVQQDDGTTRVECSTSAREEPAALFRFRGLSWVVRLKDGGGNQDWEYTGHALVIDMDDPRNLHPWLVLSREVPTKCDYDITEQLPHEGMKDDTYQIGVPPGHRKPDRSREDSYR